jgi:Flp pilus assembly protein TadG
MCSFNSGGAPGSDRHSATSTASLSTFARRYADDRRGTIAILFALMLTAVVSVVGGAVDYARWLSAKTATLSAMDSAVLAGGRALLVGQSSVAAIEVAEEYYSKNKSSVLSVDNVVFTIENTNEIVAVANSAVLTSILSVAGIDQLHIRGEARAKVEVGANAGSHVEISLMLDTTGSMSGSKITDLKTAAIDLINITVWADQSEFTSRVAVVPFAPYVNLGRNAFQVAANYSPSGSGDSKTCVKERSGSSRYTDATPNAANGYFDRYTGSWSCKPQATILPLTANKQNLQDRINDMQPSGMTAGHLGTQWTWYALSPNFANVWPLDAEPKPYSMLTQVNDNNQPILRKIAVLMTDGEYNQTYSGSSSPTQARAVCDNMKAAGIEVYTVGFGISQGGTADTTMSLCATSTEHYYHADDGDALRSAFRDIALKIATLRLIH